ncbi:MAG: polysaccharide deacetylase family protein [Lachnospiraceae bacterium]|nr:polysaccharide deacetylase family protein [Lachnospiraceae bacterium]
MRRKRKHWLRAILYIGLVIVIGFAIYQVRAAYIKAEAAKAAEAKAEAKRKEEARKKKNEWVKKDGKSYYYGADGKVVTGRFIQGKKIYYADDSGEVTRVVDGTKPMVAISYDDGPSKFTDEFVELFEENDSAATFFEVGQRIDDFKEEAQAIANSHCELANHTYVHQNLTKVSVSGMKKQINKCNRKLRELGEETDPILVRPPEGAVNDTVRENLQAPILLWSIDTLDWKSRNADSVYKKATTNVKDGDIILMHSLYESTLEASKRVVPELIDQGYQLVTITDLAEFRGGLENGVTYFNIKPLEEKEQGEEAKQEETKKEETTEEE